MPSLGPRASTREWRDLVRAGVPTFGRWAARDRRTPPPPAVVPPTVPAGRSATVLAVLWNDAAKAWRFLAELLEEAARRSRRPR
jgi:hypothetical protein